MASDVSGSAITFEELRTRLLRQVKLRIHNGEFTERGLARILGISQSQTHNVLKGVRLLQVHLADRILAKLGLSVVDLLQDGDWSPEQTDRALGDSGGAALDDGRLSSNQAQALPVMKMPPARTETRPGQEMRKQG